MAFTYTFNKWQGSRFNSSDSFNVVIDLVPYQRRDGCPEWLCEDVIDQTARRLRNKINQRVFGNATRRFGKELKIIITLHKEPHTHFHCLIEIPDHINRNIFQSDITRICFEDQWLKAPKYILETENAVGSQIYNGRNGSEAIIVF